MLTQIAIAAARREPVEAEILRKRPIALRPYHLDLRQPDDPGAFELDDGRAFFRGICGFCFELAITILALLFVRVFA